MVHLVGFTIEIYYDARPYERQIWHSVSTCRSLYRLQGELTATGCYISQNHKTTSGHEEI